MSKSRGNAVPIRATADETARLIAGARTDAERVITYEPERRPEVSSLLLLAALCRDEPPEQVAAEIGAAGAAALKRAVTDAVNQRFAPFRRRGRIWPAIRAICGPCWPPGTSGSSAITDGTLAAVRALMHTSY